MHYLVGVMFVSQGVFDITMFLRTPGAHRHGSTVGPTATPSWSGSSSGKRALRVGEAYKSERRVGARLSRTAFDDTAAAARHTGTGERSRTSETDHDREPLIAGGVSRRQSSACGPLPATTPRPVAARDARARASLPPHAVRLGRSHTQHAATPGSMRSVSNRAFPILPKVTFAYSEFFI